MLRGKFCSDANRPRLTKTCHKPGIIHTFCGENINKKTGMATLAAAAGMNCSAA